jgi:hypothetical protein
VKIVFWVGIVVSCGALFYEPGSRLAMVGLGFVLGSIVSAKR